MTNKYYQNKIIWVTGASSGIGAAFAREVVKQKPKFIILSGRNIERLEQVKSSLEFENVLVCPFDVTSEEQTVSTVNKIEQVCGGLDVVFFNAGGSTHVSIDDYKSETFTKQMEQNYYSIVHGVGAALPLLKKSQAPHIVGMSSVASFMGLPEAQGYCAAKAAARIFLEGLRGELMKYQIPVTTICPGFIETPLVSKNDFYMPFLMSAEKAAKIIAHAIAKQKPELIFPRRMKWLMRFTRILPRRFFAKVAMCSR